MVKKLRLLFWSILLLGAGSLGTVIWQTVLDSTEAILRNGLEMVSRPLVSQFEESFYQPDGINAVQRQNQEKTQNQTQNRLQNRLQDQIQNQVQSVTLDGLEAYNSGAYATAYREWRPLAELGHAEAQNNLGVMYALGNGVAQDYQAAHIWFNIAGANGNEGAKARRDYVEKRLSPDAFTQAQRLANQCIRNGYRNCP